MKISFFLLLIVIIVFSITPICSQTFEGGQTFAQSKGLGKGLGIVRGGIGNTGGLYDDSKKYDYNKIRIDGSPYLYDNWINHGQIFLDKKMYEFNNINFNLDQQQFMSKIVEDSVFVFDLGNISKIIINGNTFKNFYSKNGTNKVCEVIYENDKMSLLKENGIKIIESNPDPMLKRSTRRIRKISNYYIYKENEFTFFRPKKAFIIKLVSEDKRDKVNSIIKSEKLSLKNDEDLKRLFRYLNTI